MVKNNARKINVEIYFKMARWRFGKRIPDFSDFVRFSQIKKTKRNRDFFKYQNNLTGQK